MNSQYFLLFICLTTLCLGSCSQIDQNLYRLELERECVKCNLAGVNLARENLGVKYRIPRSNQPLSVTPFGLEEAKPVNLTQANLQEANFFQADLSGVIFYEANLQQANLEEADLEKAQLKGANLQGANLQQTNLKGANLENANLKGANLQGVTLEETNLRGIITDNQTLWYEKQE
ncbi:pentapeptide repeat-containing protein [Crocosphaera sp. UHCC 0190]|uniref:pentapeptide repeat-containing protein n=1 Tax=Crocosphaera sp. UHCC 0190 TaxID=3110246 RepID=UPI002B1F1812|nr:pentapeptide repeat-containing protein [Crocosphaera sp. UHCC 0190]MEA5508439.1 pentapeptide repeat-containing protein [Crocosphaera sp. UHCC 0190]